METNRFHRYLLLSCVLILFTLSKLYGRTDRRTCATVMHMNQSEFIDKWPLSSEFVPCLCLANIELFLSRFYVLCVFLLVLPCKMIKIDVF